MKKIVLTLALAIFAFAANAQLIISANIGGSSTSGSTFTQTKVTGGLEYTASDIVPLEKYNTITAGLKIGYQFGRCQAGISGAYTQTTGYNLPLDGTIVPILENANIPGMFITTTGSMMQKNPAITISPYFRYDIIKAGDVALFAEIDILYSKTLTPTCWAHIYDSSATSMFTHDTSAYFPHPMSTTTIGASIVPGLSWQLSKHCGIDLYLDFLAFAYQQATTIRTDMEYSFHFLGGSQLITEYTEIVTTTKEQQIGAAITGTPLLTSLGANNWVRVGFNFSF